MSVNLEDLGFVPDANVQSQPDALTDLGFIPDNAESSEGFLNSATRTAAQPLIGALKVTQPGLILSGLQLWGVGESLSALEDLEDNLPRLKKLFPDMNIPEKIDREKYFQALEDATNTFPTVGNIVKGIENVTGLPLEAKTNLQKDLQVLGMGSKIGKGSVAQRLVTGAKAASYNRIMQDSGVPESAAEILAITAAQKDIPNIFTNKKQLKPQKSPPLLGEESPPPGADGEPPPPPSGGEPGKPMFRGLIPEHELLEKLEPVLTDTYRKRIDAIGPEPKFSSTGEPIKPKFTGTDKANIERNIGKTISDIRQPNKLAGATAFKNVVDSNQRADNKIVNDLYNRAKPMNRDVSEIHPETAEELKALVKEISEAEVPSSVKKDIRMISNKYIKLLGNKTGYREVANSKFIAQVQANNQKINYDYVQGKPKNVYMKLNKILDNAIQSTESIAPEAVELYNQAKTAAAQSATKYNHPEIFKWRVAHEGEYTKIFDQIKNPDQIKFLEEALGKKKDGKNVINAIKRDYIEQQFRPYINNPKKIDSLEYNDLIKEITPITTPSQRAKIDNILTPEKNILSDYERMLEGYNQGKISHNELIKKQKDTFRGWKDKVNNVTKTFPYKSDSAILNDLKTVRGQKRLESFIPKTEEGIELLDQIKEYSTVNLLTQGKINPSDKAEPLRAIFNDINKRALIEHNLGKEVTKDLHKIINNIPKVNASAKELKKYLNVLKKVGKLIPGLRGNIATGEVIYDAVQHFIPAVNEGSYDLVDLETIQKIIENRKSLN